MGHQCEWCGKPVTCEFDYCSDECRKAEVDWEDGEWEGDDVFTVYEHDMHPDVIDLGM